VHIVFQRLTLRGFDLAFTYHSDAILSRDFPEAVQEIEQVIGEVSIPIAELVRGGGGETQGTQRLRRALNAAEWRKQIFHVETKINDRTTFAQSHEVDHIKTFERGTIALELEWNNKDPFFDRDLENFNRLHADGAISAGIIITRGASLQDGIEERLRIFARASNIQSFDDLQPFEIEPTRRQREQVRRYIERQKCSFADGWATCFIRDKYGAATTHWSKLKARLDRGIGSPCPLVAIGIPIACITD
jgi:hypothetical protein